MESLFSHGEHHPTSIISLELAAATWREPARFAEILTALAILHNRILTLRRYKEAVKKGQFLHPAGYLAGDEKLGIKAYPGDDHPCELYAFPAVARTLADFINEIAAAAPGPIPYRTLITLFKDELEILTRRHYHEDETRRLFKLDVLGPALAGARASVAENAADEQ